MLLPPLYKCGICTILRCGGFIHSFLRSWHNISIAPFYLLFTSLCIIADVYLFYFITPPQPPYPPLMVKTTLLCLMCMFCVCVLTRFPFAFLCIFLSKSFHLMWLFLLFSNLVPPNILLHPYVTITKTLLIGSSLQLHK